MKIVAIMFLAFTAAVWSAPTKISDNNIGDIINVYVNADLKVSNEIDQTFVNVIVALLNQQGIAIVPSEGQRPTPA